jgi:hypothetical protein
MDTDIETGIPASTYATKNLSFLPGYTYHLYFANTKMGFSYDMGTIFLSKTVDGAATDADRNTLFPFRLYYTDAAFGQPGPWTIPFSVSHSQDTALVKGVTADRIANDTNGDPSILWLKDGDEVSIHGLPVGNYAVIEWPDGTTTSSRFTATYRVDADSPPLPGPVARDALRVGENKTVAFVNTAPTPGPAPTGEIVIPNTGDGSAPALYALALLLSAGGLIALTARALRKRPR